MISTCPSCGSRDYIGNKTCVCGFHPDDDDPDDINSVSKGVVTKRIKEKVLKSLAESNSDKSGDEVPIKEIDSWTFTYSVKEECICIGTPALQSFRIKLAVEDLEDILEQTYRYSGEEKTIRKSRLDRDAMPELIERVSKKIEEKRQKVAVHFSDDELQEVMDVINERLKV